MRFFTKKLEEIMASVELFNQIYSFPMSNGVNCRTDMFRRNLSFEEFPTYYRQSSPSVYSQYQSVIQKVRQYDDALTEFVMSPEFKKSWNEMTKQEKDYLVFFDTNSYVILRKALDAKEIYSIDWSERVSGIRIQWTENFAKDLGLPEEFNAEPQNKVQILKQMKTLATMGYSEAEMAELKNSMPDFYAGKLFKLICKNKTNEEMEKIAQNFNIELSYSDRYIDDFFSDKEKSLKPTKLKM